MIIIIIIIVVVVVVVVVVVAVVFDYKQTTLKCRIGLHEFITSKTYLMNRRTITWMS